MCCVGCDELKIDEKCKESSLFSYISSTLEVWNLNIRFNMMWLSVLHRYGTGNMLHDLWRVTLYILHSTNWLALVSTQAGMFLHW